MDSHEDVLGAAEAAEVLEPGDKREFTSAQEAAAQQKKEGKKLRLALQARRRELARSEPRELAKKRKVTGKTTDPDRQAVKDLKKAPTSTVPQDAIARLCPPGAHVWRDLGRGRWHVHMPPYRRFSRPWEVHGESIAACLVLKRVWRLWLEDQGKSLDECPLTNLFTGDSERDRDDYRL